MNYKQQKAMMKSKRNSLDSTTYYRKFEQPKVKKEEVLEILENEQVMEASPFVSKGKYYHVNTNEDFSSVYFECFLPNSSKHIHLSYDKSSNVKVLNSVCKMDINSDGKMTYTFICKENVDTCKGQVILQAIENSEGYLEDVELHYTLEYVEPPMEKSPFKEKKENKKKKEEKIKRILKVRRKNCSVNHVQLQMNSNTENGYVVDQVVDGRIPFSDLITIFSTDSFDEVNIQSANLVLLDLLSQSMTQEELGYEEGILHSINEIMNNYLEQAGRFTGNELSRKAIQSYLGEDTQKLIKISK